MCSGELLIHMRIRYAEGNYAEAYSAANLVIIRGNITSYGNALALAYKAEAYLALNLNESLWLFIFKWYEQAFQFAQLAIGPECRIRVLRSHARSLIKMRRPGALAAMREADKLVRENNLNELEYWF